MENNGKKINQCTIYVTVQSIFLSKNIKHHFFFFQNSAWQVKIKLHTTISNTLLISYSFICLLRIIVVCFKQ